MIIVDLPPEHDEEVCLPAAKAGLNFIRLATPTTDDRRLPAVLKNTSGFIYYVSVLGITGTKVPDIAQVKGNVRAHQAPHRPAGGGGLRGEDSRPGESHRRERGRRRGRFGARQCGEDEPDARRASDPQDAEGGAVAHRAKSPRACGSPNAPHRRRHRDELDQELHSTEDPQLPRKQEGSAGEHVGEMPRDRADGVLSRSRSEPVRHPRLRLSHAHAAGRTAEHRCSTAASTSAWRSPRFPPIR